MTNQLKENRVICGDSTQELKKIPDNCIDLIITSPPYNNWKNKRTQKRKEKYWERTNIVYDNYDDKMSDEEYVDWQKNIIDEMIRILKPTGTICYNHKDQIFNFKALSPLEWILKSEAIFRQRITWDRRGMQAFNNVRFYRVEEDIYILGKLQKGFKWNKEFAKYNSIWHITPSRKLSDEHPASFPAEIPKRCIEAFTDEGDLVLDPFCGSGTTLNMAKTLNRNYIGIDISQKYVDLSNKKLVKNDQSLEVSTQ